MSDDTIYRQAALDAIKALWDSAPTVQHVSAMFDCEDAIQALPFAEPDNTCNGCRYERFGNRVCDQCSRFYMDRYEVKQDG
jgi:hypothetical protein